MTIIEINFGLGNIINWPGLQEKVSTQKDSIKIAVKFTYHLDQASQHNLQMLLSSPNVSEIHLEAGSGNFFRALFLADVIKENASLTTLHLENTPLTESELKEISEAILVHKSIRHFLLTKNGLKNSDLDSLANLMSAKFIRTLSLNLNDISSHENYKENKNPTSNRLIPSLKGQQTLQNLSLKGCKLTHKELEEIFIVLPSCSALESLDLSMNDLNSQEHSFVFTLIFFLQTQPKLNSLNLNMTRPNSIIENIINALSNRSTPLLKLSLQLCNIKDAKAFLPLIENNEVQSLDLTGNNFEPKSYNAFVRSLKANGSLETLNLSNTSLRDGTAQILSTALKQNNTVTDLNLHGNHISNDVMINLLCNLTSHPTLTSLSISNNDLDKNIIPPIRFFLYSNPRISSFSCAGIKNASNENKVKISKMAEINRVSPQLTREAYSLLCKSRALLHDQNLYDQKNSTSLYSALPMEIKFSIIQFLSRSKKFALNSEQIDKISKIAASRPTKRYTKELFLNDAFVSRDKLLEKEDLIPVYKGSTI